MSVIICKSITEMKGLINAAKKQGKSVGFVPTMGALHAGHLGLVKRAKQECDLAVASIFVNPTQFNNAHDLAVYPRTLDADCQLLAKVNCDYVFAPEASEMYPHKHQLQINFGDLEHVMEGKFRPGHFNGVGLVVSKLFHIVQPDKAYFGQKDLQQCAVVTRLVNDLSFALELVICPTERDADGLAMSSRNKNLSAEHRALAPVLYQLLLEAKERLINGVSINFVKDYVANSLAKYPLIELEYFEVVNRENLASIEVFGSNTSAICIAAFFGKTRLIDNILV